MVLLEDPIGLVCQLVPIVVPLEEEVVVDWMLVVVVVLLPPTKNWGKYWKVFGSEFRVRFMP